MNKKGNNNYNTNTFITYLIILLVIVCQIFRYKSIFIEPNHVLEVSISSIVYPFTFLLILLLNNKTNFKETHKSILKITGIFLIFMLIATILNIIPTSSSTREIDTALKNVLTPNYMLIKGHIIYYPDLLNVITFSLLFYFSHTIILILYEAMIPYTKKFIAYALSMFIPFTLDTLCYIAINDVFKEIEFNKIIVDLTSNFVIVIVFTIILTIFYSLKKIKED